MNLFLSFFFFCFGFGLGGFATLQTLFFEPAWFELFLSGFSMYTASRLAYYHVEKKKGRS